MGLAVPWSLVDIPCLYVLVLVVFPCLSDPFFPLFVVVLFCFFAV